MARLLRLLVLGGLLLGLDAVAPPFSAAQEASSVLPQDVPDTRAQQLFIKGMTQAFLDNHGEALGLYESALRYAPETAAILSAAATSHEALGDMGTALYYAEQARQYAPDNVHYYHLVAQLHARSGDLESAAEAYQTLLDRFPDDAEALRDLAQVYVLRGRDDDALATYERLIERIDGDAGLYRKVLPLYERTGDLDGAVQVVRALTDLEPDDAALWRTLGDLHERQSRLEAAAEAYEQALALDPDDVRASAALADVYRSLGRTAAADSLQAASDDLGSTSIANLIAQAETLLDQDEAGAPARAERLLREVLDRDADHAEALALLGDALYDAEAFAEAADLLDRALQQNPRAPARWRRAADAYLRAGQPDRAAAVAEDGVLLFPGQPGLLHVAGRSLLHAGDVDAAITRLDEALTALSPDDATTTRGAILEDLGDAYAQQGDVTAARQFWQDALDANPERDTLRQKLERQQY